MFLLSHVPNKLLHIFPMFHNPLSFIGNLFLFLCFPCSCVPNGALEFDIFYYSTFFFLFMIFCQTIIRSNPFGQWHDQPTLHTINVTMLSGMAKKAICWAGLGLNSLCWCVSPRLLQKLACLWGDCCVGSLPFLCIGIMYND